MPWNRGPWLQGPGVRTALLWWPVAAALQAGLSLRRRGVDGRTVDHCRYPLWLQPSARPFRLLSLTGCHLWFPNCRGQCGEWSPHARHPDPQVRSSGTFKRPVLMLTHRDGCFAGQDAAICRRSLQADNSGTLSAFERRDVLRGWRIPTRAARDDSLRVYSLRGGRLCEWQYRF